MIRKFSRPLLFIGIGLLVVLLVFLLFAPVRPGGSSASAPPNGANVSTANSAATDTCPPPLESVSSCLTPQAVRAAYGIESLIGQGYTGKGQTVVVIVSFGSPTLKQDLDVYDQTFSLPPADVQVSSPLQIPESDPHQSKEGWANTTTLDVEVIHAIAPEARIVVLTSPVAETEGTTGLAEFRQLEQYALDNKLGGVILQSWEISELTLQNQVGQQELQQWDSLFRQATTQQGVTFFASSGDNGAADYADPDGKALAADPAVGFPASSPWVTAVGGTSLSGQSANQTEHAWSGSGGGFSKLFQAPDHQKTSVANYLKQGNNQRGVPDVAAVADPATSLVMYRNGKWTMAAGTSTSASIWAAMMAIADGMANHPLGFINPTLYKLAGANSQDFRDIIDGNNTNQNAGVEGYAAAAGWDPVTGLGVPKADKLLMDLTVSIGGAS